MCGCCFAEKLMCCKKSQHLPKLGHRGIQHCFYWMLMSKNDFHFSALRRGRPCLNTEPTSASLWATDASCRTTMPLLSCSVFLCSTLLALKLSHFSKRPFLALSSCFRSLKYTKFCIVSVLYEHKVSAMKYKSKWNACSGDENNGILWLKHRLKGSAKVHPKIFP